MGERMRISELIVKLQEALSQYGDVVVLTDLAPDEGPHWVAPTFVMYRDYSDRDDVFVPRIFEDGHAERVTKFVTLE